MRSRKRREAKAHGYKSGFELTTARQLEAAGVAYEYEPVGKKIKFTPPDRTYCPDFVIGDVIVETKGRFTGEDRAKHLLIKAQHLDKEVRFVFLYDNKLSKTSNTRYSDWATKHGFKYALTAIPDEWIDEFKAAAARKSKADKSAKGRKSADGVLGTLVSGGGRSRTQTRSRQVRTPELAN